MLVEEVLKILNKVDPKMEVWLFDYENGQLPVDFVGIENREKCYDNLDVRPPEKYVIIS